MPVAKSYVTPELLRAIATEYQLDPAGFHGFAHWSRVCEFGRRLADASNVDRRLVELFALVHDCRRLDDGHDVLHGARAADALRGWQGTLIQLDTTDLDRLLYACEHHTAGKLSDDPLIGVCWDADRLDLSRLKYEIDVDLLSTAAAKDPRVLYWARQLSEELVTPALLRQEWSLLLER
ncbi:MAG: hypothetical protein ABIJ61_10825 [bacterium]